MSQLQRLRLDHAPALLEFEQVNRAYFAASIPDRGDDYFAHFDARHHELMAEQAAGLHHFHVLVNSSGAVLGRVNLIDVTDGSAELGYRIAEQAAGRGLTTAAVREVCALAAGEYGLSTLRAVHDTRQRRFASRTGPYGIHAHRRNRAGRPPRPALRPEPPGIRESGARSCARRQGIGSTEGMRGVW